MDKPCAVDTLERVECGYKSELHVARSISRGFKAADVSAEDPSGTIRCKVWRRNETDIEQLVVAKRALQGLVETAEERVKKRKKELGELSALMQVLATRGKGEEKEEEDSRQPWNESLEKRNQYLRTITRQLLDKEFDPGENTDFWKEFLERPREVWCDSLIAETLMSTGLCKASHDDPGGRRRKLEIVQ